MEEFLQKKLNKLKVMVLTRSSKPSSMHFGLDLSQLKFLQHNSHTSPPENTHSGITHLSTKTLYIYIAKEVNEEITGA